MSTTYYRFHCYYWNKRIGESNNHLSWDRRLKIIASNHVNEYIKNLSNSEIIEYIEKYGSKRG
jgi:hypothetical protein